MSVVKLYQEFCTSTAIYPQKTSDTLLQRLMYLSLGLNGEAGEVAEIIKKWYRDGNFSIEDFEKEAGDILWYLASMCNELGASLESILLKNKDKLIDRQNRGVLRGSGDNR